MSNKLKKKKNYNSHVRAIKQCHAQNVRNKQVTDSCINEIFKSLQMANLYILYLEFDYSKQQIKNFNKRLHERCAEYKDDGSTMEEMKKKHLNIGFDCTKEAVNFPYRVRRKMVDSRIVSMSDHMHLIASTNVAIETFLVLTLDVLRYDRRLSGADIKFWWEKYLEFAQLYADGLTDKHVEQYFDLECKLEFAEV